MLRQLALALLVLSQITITASAQNQAPNEGPIPRSVLDGPPEILNRDDVGDAADVEDAPPEPQEAVQGDAKPKEEQVARLDGIKDELLFTTYFYTATEAIIHGFENNTHVRIISMDKGGTVFEGDVDANKTIHVPTGRGVFSFVANKKASILVGTPSSCTVVGYWLRGPEGSFRGDHLFTQLPQSAGSSDCRVVVWAWEDVEATIADSTADKEITKAKIKKGSYLELNQAALMDIGNHVLEFRADKPAISVQVYYDEGFFVPAEDGRGAGRLFYTYVGLITEQSNDLNLISHYTDANVKVVDINDDDKLIWEGKVAEGDVHTLNLKGKHVKITSDVEICALVAPYEHYKSGYAEHHFAVGGEGAGIENRFLLTTPQELWVFSYYDNNNVKVFNAKTEELVWSGILHRGHVEGVHPGHGYYRVESSRGVSVMGGAQACGAEFSPASGLFKVDEALFKVVQQIRQQRIEEAAQRGDKLTASSLNAPLSQDELKVANDAVRKATGRATYSDAEVEDRLRDLNTADKKQ